MRYFVRPLVFALLIFSSNAAFADQWLDFLFGRPTLSVEWTYQTGVFDESAAEIVAYDTTTQRIFVTNGNDSRIDVLNSSDGSSIGVIDVSDLGDPTSVSAFRGLVAIAVDSGESSIPGNVVLADATSLQRITIVEVGFLPDMLTFTPNGRKILVANEGEPNDDYTFDPEGSISIIDVRNPNNPGVAEATFQRFNADRNELLEQGVRIFGPNATVAQDLEPEFISVSRNSRMAYVSLQENNAIAVVDLRKNRVVRVEALGYKDHSAALNGFDASNRDEAINIQPWPTVGMYQPDSIACFRRFGVDYIVTANEGDARDYDGFSEELRVKDLALDPTAYPDAEFLQADENLGRLKTTSANGDFDNDGDVDQIFSYGARSFSIWRVDRRGNVTQVFDSENEFEFLTAEQFPDDFNSTDNENSSFDDRSDDKGPEPEALAVGSDLFQTFSLIGLERIGGIMVYEITNPASPRFIEYSNNRDFSGNPEEGTAGDLAPEGIVFVPRGQSSFVEPVAIVSNEVSGTTTLYRIKRVGGLLSRFLNGRN